MGAAASLSAETDAVTDADIVKETVDGAEIIKTDTFLDSQEQDEAVAKLKEDPEVEYAEPDYIIAAAPAGNPGNPPNDPYFRNYQWNLRAIDAPGAWSMATGQNTIIGIADTGQTSHPDLNAKYVQGYDFISTPSHSRDGNGRDWNPNDEGDWGPNYSATSTWHGTHVAGIAAASSGNGIGVAGVAPDAKIQHARVMGKDGTTYTSDQAAGVAWSAGVPVPGVPQNPTPASVVNFSEGVLLHSCPQVMQDAINKAHQRNVPVVVSAGNNGINASGSMPANCWNAIVVGSSTINNTMAGYSNWGAMLDVLAPGGDAYTPVWSTKNTGTYGQGSPSYGTLYGTSMAAPHVAGIVALMKERNPNLTVEQIRSILQSTGSTINGYKMVNARRAVAAVAPNKPRYVVKNGIKAIYDRSGGAAALGQPTGNEYMIEDGAYTQHFSKGYSIYWHPRYGAATVKTTGAIGMRFNREGKTKTFGFPVENEVYLNIDGGYRQIFILGNKENRMYWSNFTGSHRINGRGAIYGKWLSRGHLRTDGYPLTDEAQTYGGYVQYFRNAAGKETGYWWSGSTGTHTLNSRGAIFAYWRDHGYISTYGFPITDETRHSDGSYSVKFSKGATITWTGSRGIRVSR